MPLLKEAINIFDLNVINKRYFEIKIGNTVLEIEPPTKKMLSKITLLRSIKEEDVTDGLYEAVGMILDKNKSGKKLPPETIDELNLDQINEIITAYFTWLSKEKNSPN